MAKVGGTGHKSKVFFFGDMIKAYKVLFPMPFVLYQLHFWFS